MNFQDFVITPIYFIGLSVLIFFWISQKSAPATKKYLLPALWLKFFGAIGVGLVYQFYYGGGDTFGYHTHGSVWILKAFLDNPIDGLRLIFGPRNYQVDLYNYFTRIWYYRDDNSFFLVRITGLFDLLTFGTYSATALFFATFSFVGAWKFYQIIIRIYPVLINWGAFSILFLPSVVFWGSGIFKDSIALGALFLLFSNVLKITYFKEFQIRNFLVILISAFLIYSLKQYILIAFVAASAIYLAQFYTFSIRFVAARWLMAPFLLLIFGLFGYFLSDTIGGDAGRYALGNIVETAFVTAQDIRFGWGKAGGSGFYLGFDGSIGGMISLFPQALNVALFRPYLWEAGNPLMLLAALEALFLFLFTLSILFRSRLNLRLLLSNPLTTYFLIFAIIFAFAVGISTTNFGTLVRYKIPLMPFYLLGLQILNHSIREKARSSRNFSNETS